MIFHKTIKFLALITLLLCGIGYSAGQVHAQTGEQGLMPPTGAAVTIESTFSNNEITHPPLRVTPDKSEIVHLDEPVDRVIIGNDSHINVHMDTQRRMVIVPRAPGATHFSLLNGDGKIIMQRHVIVASPQERYVRIRETCTTSNCMPIRMFYCPGMCHEIGLIGEDGTRFSGSVSTDDEDDDDQTLADLLSLNANGGDGDGGNSGGGEE